MSAGRLCVDVSYTRTQRTPIGICRVVHRLFDEFRAQQVACTRVAFHSSGFREVPPGHEAPDSSGGEAACAGHRMLGWFASAFARRLVRAAVALAPKPLLQGVWRVASVATFDALSRQDEPFAFRKGDILFLADASWKYPVWDAAARARAEGARVVLMVHDLMPIRHPEYCFSAVPMLFDTWLRRMLAGSDAVVCNSRATEEDLRAWAAENSLAGSLPPVSHFRLGCDLPNREPGTVRAAVASFLAAQQPCFATVGSFEPKKNFGVVIDVFENLWARGFDVLLVMAGRPTAECSALVERLRSHPEQGRRMLTLFDASDAEVDCLYQRSRALLFPSLMEGFGLPLVEARARGCPVIASDLPVFIELADAGVTLFDRFAPEALEAAVVEHARADCRAAAGVQPPFLWRDSARQLQERIAALMPPSTAQQAG